MERLNVTNIIFNKYKIYHFNEIDSTNLFLKNNYNMLEEYSVITSDVQTAGRGRLGRTWHTNDKNIAISILLKPDFINNISLLSLVTGASVYKTISKYTKCMIKWPNDILIGDKKVCGILLESVISNKIDALIIGVGININQTEFEEDIKTKATSLKKELNIDFDKEEIVNEFIKNFDYLYMDYLKGNNEYMKIVKDNSYLTGKTGYINNQGVKILDINDDGTLKVLLDDKVKNVNSGEVTLEKFYH